MPKCPSCETEVESPNYRQRIVEPKSDREGVTVTATTGVRYWLVLCPDCDAILGTVKTNQR